MFTAVKNIAFVEDELGKVRCLNLYPEVQPISFAFSGKLPWNYAVNISRGHILQTIC
jgi:hypothetical protein